MAKESIYNRGSVKEGENEVVCQSRFHAPSHVRNGSYIRFYGDGAMYQIGKVEPFFCILNFRKELSSRVFIEDENAITIVAGDMMEISYKEYELSNSVKIMDGGIGYSVGDILEVDEGVPMEDQISQDKSYAKIQVMGVDEDGAITSVAVADHGKYFESPPEQVSLGWMAKGCSGKEAELALFYKTIDHRSAIKREVASLEIVKGGYMVVFTNSLPKEVYKGKLSCKKYKLILSSNYVSLTKWSEEYQLIVDFTPNYGLPLMLDNSLSIPLVYNKCMTIMDNKIRNLEKEIEELKSKLN